MSDLKRLVCVDKDRSDTPSSTGILHEAAAHLELQLQAVGLRHLGLHRRAAGLPGLLLGALPLCHLRSGPQGWWLPMLQATARKDSSLLVVDGLPASTLNSSTIGAGRTSP